MERVQQAAILSDLEEKLVLLTGPRQVGKTTLARSLRTAWPGLEYLNYDTHEDRRIITRQTWNREVPLVIFDELHKQPKWKAHLKGIYDTEGVRPRILVTGSARLDAHRRGGDSLAGRYHRHRLLPLSVRELGSHATAEEKFEQLLRFGGFPEPFLKQSETAANRWRKSHLDQIIREDVQDLEPVRDVQALVLLVDLLRERVGSTISYSNLARDLEISPHTVKRWVQTLANMFVVFVVTPYTRNLARALLKEPKIYFYDVGAVVGDEGAKVENLVAVSLLKHLWFIEDTEGRSVELHYVRDKEKREVDFLTVVDRKPDTLVEVKATEADLHRPLAYFRERIRPRHAVQLVGRLKHPRTSHGIHIQSAAGWLEGLSL